MSTAISTGFFDFDAATVDQWAAYHRYRRLRAAEDTPDEPVLGDADFEHLVRRQWRLIETRRYIARAGEEVIGNLYLESRRKGTPDYDIFAPFLSIGGGVLHPHRRRGVGTALLRQLLAFMEAHQKQNATLSVHLPEAHAFLGAIGATEKLRMYENRLALAGLDWAELARWKDAAATPTTGLRWEIHAGRVPIDRLARLMGPFSRLVGDMPRGELAGPPLRFELQGHLGWYEELDRIGGDHLVVMLLDGEEVAAVCNAHWDARFGDRVYQALTAVARGWRGKGLAKSVKAAMLRLVQSRYPQVRTIITTNAEMNGPILSINQRLGFVTHRRNGHYQVDPQMLRDFLSRRPTAANTRASER